jgi:hypothetical protein
MAAAARQQKNRRFCRVVVSQPAMRRKMIFFV